MNSQKFFNLIAKIKTDNIAIITKHCIVHTKKFTVKHFFDGAIVCFDIDLGFELTLFVNSILTVVSE